MSLLSRLRNRIPAPQKPVQVSVPSNAYPFPSFLEITNHCPGLYGNHCMAFICIVTHVYIRKQQFCLSLNGIILYTFSVLLLLHIPVCCVLIQFIFIAGILYGYATNYPFYCCWTSGLFLGLDYYEQCCCEYS